MDDFKPAKMDSHVMTLASPSASQGDTFYSMERQVEKNTQLGSMSLLIYHTFN